jgi:hypothetical protein
MDLIVQMQENMVGLKAEGATDLPFLDVWATGGGVQRNSAAGVCGDSLPVESFEN